MATNARREGKAVCVKVKLYAPLTYREFQGVRCLKQGLDSAVAAERLNISKDSAKQLYQRVRRKLGARTLPQLVYWLNCDLFYAGLMVKPEKH